nr:unnamed protein product [Digitaria exilis]
MLDGGTSELRGGTVPSAERASWSGALLCASTADSGELELRRWLSPHQLNELDSVRAHRTAPLPPTTTRNVVNTISSTTSSPPPSDLISSNSSRLTQTGQRGTGSEALPHAQIITSCKPDMAGRINQNELRFFLSCGINLPVSFRIVHADNTFSVERTSPELFVECKLYNDGMPFGLPVKTRLQSSGPPHTWNELITLTTKYRDLTSLSQLAFTVWDVSSGDHDIVGGATISIFNSKKQLRTGRQKLRLWTKKEADGRVPNTTPGKIPKNERGEIERLDRLINKYERGQIQRVDWLDRLAFRAVEKTNIKEKECKRNDYYPSLVVDFCDFAPTDYRVVFQESGGNFHVPTTVSSSNELVTIWDPELGRTNPSEHKQSKVSWSLTDGIINRDHKPNPDERKLLQKIVKFPPTRPLMVDEKQLVWEFRFFFMSDKKALTKFVHSVDWGDIQVGSVMEDVRNVHGSTQKKIEKLRQSLSEVLSEPTNFDEPTRSPLAPNVLLTGVVPEQPSIFKSTLHPLRLTFKTGNGGTSKIIFKKGDDLRLDQLVIQMVSLMDRLLKLENLDLHLTPYRVLATGQDEGMIEFIPSSSLAQVTSY